MGDLSATPLVGAFAIKGRNTQVELFAFSNFTCPGAKTASAASSITMRVRPG
jgi:hypothetical protein